MELGFHSIQLLIVLYICKLYPSQNHGGNESRLSANSRPPTVIHSFIHPSKFNQLNFTSRSTCICLDQQNVSTSHSQHERQYYKRGWESPQNILPANCKLCSVCFIGFWLPIKRAVHQQLICRNEHFPIKILGLLHGPFASSCLVGLRLA